MMSFVLSFGHSLSIHDIWVPCSVSTHLEVQDSSPCYLSVHVYFIDHFPCSRAFPNGDWCLLSVSTVTSCPVPDLLVSDLGHYVWWRSIFPTWCWISTFQEPLLWPCLTYKVHLDLTICLGTCAKRERAIMKSGDGNLLYLMPPPIP